LKLYYECENVKRRKKMDFIKKAKELLVQGMTLKELIETLKNISESIDEVAKAAKEAFEEVRGEAPSALELAQALEDVYKTGDADIIRGALTYAGYEKDGIEDAILIIFSITVTVDSRLPFQDELVSVSPSRLVTIEYVSGRWTMNPAEGYCDAGGIKRLIAKPGYALEGAPEGAMIGKIGDDVFLVGLRAESPKGTSGKLSLCPNDDLYKQYGRGLDDNDGKIVMRIKMEIAD
jgi:hypothetical protein